MSQNNSSKHQSQRGYQPAREVKPLGGYRPDQTDKPRGPPPNVGSGAQKPSSGNSTQPPSK